MKSERQRIMVLPNVQAMMTGVWRIARTAKTGVTTLYYTDGQTESAVLDSKEWREDNAFSVIGTVQQKARA